MAVQKIDFKTVRENADFQAVAKHYGIDLIKDGSKPDQFKGICPFHDDTKPSLKVHTGKKVYNCFACGAHGNVLNFVKEIEGTSYRDAAKILLDIQGQAPAPPKPNESIKQTSPTPDDKSEFVEDGEIGENRVLNFSLKELDTTHPFLAERGIDADTAKNFGLGVTTRSKLLKDRLAIPIHNQDGELVAYCGRFPSADMPDDEPKYKLPPNFRKELELFNWHRCKDAFASGKTKTLILVESYFSVFHLHNHFPVVSPMGWSVSLQQIAIIKQSNVEKVVLLFDGDDAGRHAVTKAGREFLKVGLPVIAPVVQEDFKPHRVAITELGNLLDGCV
jgi:DNA primase